MENKDHPDQAVDTDVPDDTVNEEAFKALQENYEGDPEDAVVEEDTK